MVDITPSRGHDLPELEGIFRVWGLEFTLAYSVFSMCFMQSYVPGIHFCSEAGKILFYNRRSSLKSLCKKGVRSPTAAPFFRRLRR